MDLNCNCPTVLLSPQIFSTLIKLVQIRRKSDPEKELEIMILRYQLAIVERNLVRVTNETARHGVGKTDVLNKKAFRFIPTSIHFL